MANWIISHNPNTYRTIKAFIELQGVIDQATSNNIHTGDFVFIYLSDPIRKIMLKTIVIDENISYKSLINDNEYFVSEETLKEFEDKNKTSRFIRLKAIKYFDDDVNCKLTLESLRNNGYEGNMQGAIQLENNEQLFDYIKSVI